MSGAVGSRGPGLLRIESTTMNIACGHAPGLRCAGLVVNSSRHIWV